MVLAEVGQIRRPSVDVRLRPASWQAAATMCSESRSRGDAGGVGDGDGSAVGSQEPRKDNGASGRSGRRGGCRWRRRRRTPSDRATSPAGSTRRPELRRVMPPRLRRSSTARGSSFSARCSVVTANRSAKASAGVPNQAQGGRSAPSMGRRADRRSRHAAWCLPAKLEKLTPMTCRPRSPSPKMARCSNFFDDRGGSCAIDHVGR